MVDFTINLKRGSINTKRPRSIICKRCLDDPLMKECLTMIDEVEKLPKPPAPAEKFKPVEGAICCSRCGKRLTEEVPHVALAISWDVNYESIRTENHFMCKECYSRDKKTQMVWKFLAKLGKNPPFRPQMKCASSYRCATFEPGPTGFECNHIRVMPAMIKMKGGTLGYDTYKLFCGRCHPGRWEMPSEKNPRKLVSPSWLQVPPTLQQATNAPAPTGGTVPVLQAMTQMKKCALLSVEKLERAVKATKDPGLKLMIESQLDFFKMFTGMFGG